MPETKSGARQALPVKNEPSLKELFRLASDAVFSQMTLPVSDARTMLSKSPGVHSIPLTSSTWTKHRHPTTVLWWKRGWPAYPRLPVFSKNAMSLPTKTL